MKDYINIFIRKVKVVDMKTRRYIKYFKEIMEEKNEIPLEINRAWRKMETENIVLENRNRVLEKALVKMTAERELDKKDRVGIKRKKKVKGEVKQKLDVDRRKGKKEKVNVDQDQLTVKGEKKRKKGATFNEVSRGRRKILEEIEGKDKARIRECFLWVEYWYNYCKALVVIGIPLWYLLVKKETNYLYDKNTTAVIISNKLAGPCLR